MEIRIVGSINGMDEANLIKSITKVFMIENRIKTIINDKESLELSKILAEQNR